MMKVITFTKKTHENENVVERFEVTYGMPILCRRIPRKPQQNLVEKRLESLHDVHSLKRKLNENKHNYMKYEEVYESELQKCEKVLEKS
ncbi:CLUMA_CG002294, isoform A [Clunio marinus]|uniref:CLUMA_CG002294, isoform A n=1 Tax=Clunio marinus TaxID=568069 RepID=A0A1J1HKH7_9DIPT|nr:CLUMA_CG002294, isoform A [Clunio marinus]